MSVMEIMHEIDTLPAPERWQVLEHTRQTFEPEFEPDGDGIPAGHKQIIADRLADYRSGKAKLITREEVMRRVQAKPAAA